MGDIPVGYTRMQMSKDTAANWEKYNPALLPGEMVIVANPDGKASVKVNMGTSDIKYEDAPTVWDESTADQLKTNLADTRQAASAAADAQTLSKQRHPPKQSRKRKSWPLPTVSNLRSTPKTAAWISL